MGSSSTTFEQQAFPGGGVSVNFLFDAEETETAVTLGRYADVIASAKNFGWPVWEYDSLTELAAQLTAGGAKCFEVHSSCGLSGFVFALSMGFRHRESRAMVAGISPVAPAELGNG